MRKRLSRTQERFGLRLKFGIPALMLLITVVLGQVCKALVDSAAAGASPEVQTTLIDLSHRLQYVIWGGAVVATLFGVALAYVIIVPLKQVARSIESLASGKEAPSLQNTMGNEIGYLFESFNRMADSFARLLPERARFLFHHVSSGILTVDHKGALTNINSAADRILELHGANVSGRMCEQVFSSGETGPLLAVLRRAWQKGLTVEERRIRIRTSPGSRKTLVITTGVSKSSSGKGYDVVASFMDLTRIEAVSAKIQHEDKLSVVGRLASGVAHEIRNPLASMRGIAQLLRETPLVEDSVADRYLDVIIREVDRLNAVVEQLLEFARPSQDQRRPVDVARFVHTAADLVKARVRSREASLEIELQPSLPPCAMVADRMTQVLLNLLMNAADAVEPGGKIRVTASRLGGPGGVEDGVRISVFNTGSYIPPEERTHLFEPFYTTKERGTGLGLAVSYQIVAAHGGSLTVETVRRTGTTFHCTLPLGEREGSAVGGERLVSA